MNFVYLTTNLVNGKQYVGSHKGMEDDNYLGSGKLLLYSVKKYGKENFKRKILEECFVENNLLLETKYIKKYNTLVPSGYNILENGGYNIWTDELRKKISDKQKGKTLSEEHKKKIGDAHRGKKRDPKIGEKIRETRIKNNSYFISEEQKEQIRQTLTGRTNGPHSEETKEKIRKGNLGKVMSNEAKKKMSIAKKGKGHPHTEETKKKLRESHKGKKLSKEHIEKLRESHRGIKQKRTICEYCGKDVAVNMYSRYHGNNCKIKTNYGQYI